MFKANSLMLKVRSNKLDDWEKLQNEIRWRAEGFEIKDKPYRDNSKISW